MALCPWGAVGDNGEHCSGFTARGRVWTAVLSPAWKLSFAAHKAPEPSPIILKFNKLAYVPLPKLRGGGAIICEPDAVTRKTASPRSQVPSLRKRNRPSMPVKPDGLDRTAVLNHCQQWVLTSAAAM